MTSINHNSFTYSFFLIGTFLFINSCGPTRPDIIDGTDRTPAGNRYLVTGKVLDQNSDPIEGALVSIPALQDVEMETNAQGVFETGSDAKLFKEEITANIKINAYGYTWKDYEGGKVQKIKTHNEKIGPFWLEKLTGFEDIRDTDGDGVLDNIDNCIKVSNPDQIDKDGNNTGDACEKKNGVLEIAKASYFTIQFRPKSIVKNITKVMIEDKQVFNVLNEEKENASNFIFGNEMNFQKSSTMKNIEIHFNNSDPRDIDFNDEHCNQVNNLLILNFNINNEIEKTDCFK